jgi:hypothetical protein
MSDATVKFSERGFARWPGVVDNRGVTIRVAESSAADGPYLWVFTTGGAESYKREQDGSAHLTLEQATALRDSLTSAIEFMRTRFDGPDAGSETTPRMSPEAEKLLADLVASHENKPGGRGRDRPPLARTGDARAMSADRMGTIRIEVDDVRALIRAVNYRMGTVTRQSTRRELARVRDVLATWTPDSPAVSPLGASVEPTA